MTIQRGGGPNPQPKKKAPCWKKAAGGPPDLVSVDNGKGVLGLGGNVMKEVKTNPGEKISGGREKNPIEGTGVGIESLGYPTGI